MKPKISAYYPFNYIDLLNNAKYGFMADKPMIVIDENNKCVGYEIDIYNDGIQISGQFTTDKKLIDIDSLTIDINNLICEWLIKNKEYSLINYN